MTIQELKEAAVAAIKDITSENFDFDCDGDEQEDY